MTQTLLANQVKTCSGRKKTAHDDISKDTPAAALSSQIKLRLARLATSAKETQATKLATPAIMPPTTQITVSPTALSAEPAESTLTSMINHHSVSQPQLTKETWLAVDDELKILISGRRYFSFLARLHLLDYDATSKILRLGVPNLTIMRTIEREYLAVITQAIVNAGFDRPASIKIEISAALFRETHSEIRREQANLATTKLESAVDFTPTSPKPDAKEIATRLQLNPQYRLDNFVTGGSAQMALAAINHIVITPGTYNPLIIWGGTGVGKTHLVQGYCRAILEADPTKRVVYQTGEQFALSYQKAISERSLATMETWRNRLRKADVLVIDNVQFLARGNKVATQEEFLNTLDFLHNRGAQIVLTLDIAPELCEGFSKGVLSRICSGLNTPIDPPDNQYRQNIIASKWGERHSTALSAELLAHLAQHTAGTSPRDIEGIVQRLSALVDLSNAVLNRQTVDKALGLTVRSEQPRPNLRQIGEAVASVYDIELSKLTGNSRAGNLRLARQVAYLMCRKLTAASLSEIGQFFGKRAHSTILSALKGAPNNWSKETLVYLKNAMAALGLQLRALGDIFEQGELGL